jgi:hypothetical protein
MSDFRPGDRVIYTRFVRPRATEHAATVVRYQETGSRQLPMYVIQLDTNPKPRQVSAAALRKS